MKLSDGARQNGITYKTVWKCWKAGKLPVPARQMPTGTILVDAAEREEVGAALYARVSSPDPKADLDRQVSCLAAFAAENGLLVAKVVAEVGSGLNGQPEGPPRRAAFAGLWRHRGGAPGPSHAVWLGVHRGIFGSHGQEIGRCGPRRSKGRSATRRPADQHVRAAPWSPVGPPAGREGAECSERSVTTGQAFRYVRAEMPLGDRVLRCEARGLPIDRDLNPARNLASLVAGSPETTDACAAEGSGQENRLVKPAAAKQESPSRKLAAPSAGHRMP